MFQRLFSYLDLVYSFSKPETVFLGVDGPGPLAKILTQRARRMDRAKNEGDDSSSRLPNAIDTLQFTPGTTFMERLTQYLHYYAGRRVITTSDRPLRVYVSGADDCGEGELKIFEHMRSLASKEDLYKNRVDSGVKRHPMDFLRRDSSEKSKQKSRCLVVGNDSDLILFSLRHSHIFDIDILKNENDLSHDLLSVSKLRECLIEDVYGPRAASRTEEEKQSVIDDFILISLFNGNDYIPRLRPFDFMKVWSAYSLLRRSKFGSKPLWHQPLATSLQDYTCPSIDQEQLKTLFKVASYSRQMDKELFDEFKTAENITTHIHETLSDRKFEYRPMECFLQGSYQVGMYCDGKLLGYGIGKSPEAAQEASYGTSMTRLKSMYQEKNLERVRTLPDHLCSMSSIRDQFRGYYQEEEDYKYEPQNKEERDLQHKLYLTGIAWIMEYFAGRCLDYRFHYPFSSAPIIQEFVQDQILSKPVPIHRSDALAQNPVEFLMTVSPQKQCAQFVSSCFQGFIQKHQEFLTNLDDAPWRRNFHTIVESIHTTMSGWMQSIKPQVLESAQRSNTLSPSHVFMSLTADFRKRFSFIPPKSPKKQNFVIPPDSLLCLSSGKPNRRERNHFNSPSNDYMVPRNNNKRKE